jgi:hypothetical protein
MIGQAHDYKRHGTSTPFAALNVGTGQITGRHDKRRRRVEFGGVMNRIVKQYQGKEIHVILDNLSAHKPKRTYGSHGTRTCISTTCPPILRG